MKPRSTTKTGWSVLGLLCGLFTSCTEQAEVECLWDGSTANLVRVDHQEVAGAERWGLSELWRAGGLESDSELTQPTMGRVGPNGVIALPDFSLGVVWLLDGRGKWLEPVGAPGQGPGEFSFTLAAAWNEEDQLLVLDAGSGKLEQFDLERGVVQSFRVPADLIAPVFASGEVGWFGLRSDGVAYLQYPAVSSGPETEDIVFAAGGPGDESRRVVWRSSYPAWRVPDYAGVSLSEWPRALVGVGSESWVVAPATDRYEIIRFGLDDEPELYLCVSDREVFGAPDTTGAEIPEYVHIVSDTLRPPERAALFSRLVIDRDSRLWVERDLARSGAHFDRMYGVPGATLDVISREGEFLARVHMPAGLRFQDAAGDTIWAFEIGDFGGVTIVASEIVPTRR